MAGTKDEIPFITVALYGVIETCTGRMRDIRRCRFTILMPEHYREDGSCKCDDRDYRNHMIRHWGYKEKDFDGIPLREEE